MAPLELKPEDRGKADAAYDQYALSISGTNNRPTSAHSLRNLTPHSPLPTRKSSPPKSKPVGTCFAERLNATPVTWMGPKLLPEIQRRLRFASSFAPGRTTNLRRRGSLIVGALRLPTSAGWQTVAGFKKLSEDNA